MNALKQLHDSGQSIWIDTITRDLLTSGTLVRYIEELSVTGLTSNPTIFEKAISGSASYDADTYYVSALASVGTVNTLPEKTLLAFRDHGEVGELLTADASCADGTIEAVEKRGIDVDALADQLQIEGCGAFSADFENLLRGIEEKAAGLSQRRSGRGTTVRAP